MKSKTVFDDDVLRDMWGRDIPSKVIADHFGCKYPRVNEYAKSIGLQPRNNHKMRSISLDGFFTRADDERVLGWLKDRFNGKVSGQIAARDAVDRVTVERQTMSVRTADLKYSGEPKSRVMSAYW